jgi:hypothetical protein
MVNVKCKMLNIMRCYQYDDEEQIEADCDVSCVCLILRNLQTCAMGNFSMQSYDYVLLVTEPQIYMWMWQCDLQCYNEG